MSTRSFVGLVQPDGTIGAIYVHANGSPTWNGAVLLASYATPARIQALLALGFLSELGPELGEKHSFNTHHTEHPDWCLAYMRDRGQTDAHLLAHTHADVAGFLADARDWDAEFAYLFADGRWYVSACPWGSPQWGPRQLLADVLDAVADQAA